MKENKEIEITEKIREVYDQTPQEFCNDFYGDEPVMGGQV